MINRDRSAIGIDLKYSSLLLLKKKKKNWEIEIFLFAWCMVGRHSRHHVYSTILYDHDAEIRLRHSWRISSLITLALRLVDKTHDRWKREEEEEGLIARSFCPSPFFFHQSIVSAPSAQICQHRNRMRHLKYRQIYGHNMQICA